MNKKQETKVSKFLSLVLRHKPEEINLTLDENGWADIDVLLQKLNARDFNITLMDLEQVVQNNAKKRFIIEGNKIRANQGHSISINLDLTPTVPPNILYHGTAQKNLSSILKNGIIKGSRNHVHLSDNIETAKEVGRRHGKPVILNIDTQTMHSEGHLFYLSKNGVWLTDFIDAKYILSYE